MRFLIHILAVFVEICFVFCDRTFSTLQDMAARGDFPMGCTVRTWNFTAVKTDLSGKKCQGNVSTTACFGSCDTSEYGTPDFPNKKGRQIVCNYNRVRERFVILTDCDVGAKIKTRNFTYVEALSCLCDKCNPKTTLCIGKPEK